MAYNPQDKDDMHKSIKEIIASTGWAMMSYRRDGILYCDYQTYGLQETYDHPDLQIVLPMSIEQASQILSLLVYHVRGGVVFKPGEEYMDLLDGHTFRVSPHKHDSEHRLRVIISDEKNRYPEDPDCDSDYAYQELPFEYMGGFVHRKGEIISSF